MQYCNQCGHEFKQEATFCNECGTRIGALSEGSPSHETGLSSKQVRPKDNPIKRMTRKQKMVTGLVAGLVIIFFILFQVGSSMTSKEASIEKLEEAIVNKDEKELAKWIVSSDSRLKVDEKNVKGFLNYINENPKYLSDLISDLEKQARALDPKDDPDSLKAVKDIFENEYYESDNLLTLKQQGKSALVFDRYRFEIKPFYINVRTNYDGAKIYLNDKEIATSDSNNFTKEFGPYIPGTYKLRADYTGDYAKMSTEKEINMFDYDGYVDVQLRLEAMYISATSNYSDSMVYVNGKDSGISVGDFDDFGPVSPGVKIQAVRKFPWGEIKSEENVLKSGKSYYELNLTPETDEYRVSLKELLKEYQKSRAESIVSLDGSKLINASADYKESLSEEIEEWKEAGYKYHGGLKDMTVDMDYGEIRYDDGEETYTTRVRYISNFKGDWTYGNETSEDIEEAKTKDETVYNYIDLVYDPTSKNWIVTKHSDRAWSFTIEDGEKISF